MCFVRTKGLAVRLTKTESSSESNSTTASDETEHDNEGLTNTENIATKEDSYFYNFHLLENRGAREGDSPINGCLHKTASDPQI